LFIENNNPNTSNEKEDMIKFNNIRCFVHADTERRIVDAINKENMKKNTIINTAKDKFIRKIFHELKTPLHILSNSLHYNLIQNSNDLKALEIQVSF
jgi:signal transduction histidine kinase